MQEEQENNAEVMNRLNLSGYEVVRAQYFSTLQNPAMTISMVSCGSILPV